MRNLSMAAALVLLAAAPLFAQEKSTIPEERGYITGVGGFTTSVGNTTGAVQIEGGVRIAPHVMAIGNIGRYSDIQADIQPTIDAATSMLAANQGLNVIGSGKLPAGFFTGGLRADVPTSIRLRPYILGTIGVAHLTPSATFAFSSGTMPDGSTPNTGDDVTTTLVASGIYTPPSSSNAFMFTFGGGVEVPVAPHWIVNADYRYSRIAADTTLSATPLNLNGMTFGFGYRF